MTNYKAYGKTYIGSSDIASLTISTCGLDEFNETNAKTWGLFNLNFGAFGDDGSYYAYVVNDAAEIGANYREVVRGRNWVRIYDDNGMTFYAHAREIVVYRAGEMGCIIQLLSDPEIIAEVSMGTLAERQ